MKMPRFRTLLLVPVVLFAILYGIVAIKIAFDDTAIETLDGPFAEYSTIAIFGASGTAGDGILKAALADEHVDKIVVITRRLTPRIEEGIAAGKVEATIHMDYLDYSAVREQLGDVSAVFWAIGTSTIGVDEKTYGMIHVDFPAQFVTEWLEVSGKPGISFHYISSSDIAEDSSMMWAREKVRAEKTLFGIAEGTKLRVIAYRHDYIGPTKEEETMGSRMLYRFFAPVGAAVRARRIGDAMLEVTARGEEFRNGAKLGTRRITLYGHAHTRRHLALDWQY